MVTAMCLTRKRREVANGWLPIDCLCEENVESGLRANVALHQIVSHASVRHIIARLLAPLPTGCIITFIMQ